MYSSLTLSVAHFGSFQLSSSGEWLLYVAEKEKPKATSYFKKGSLSWCHKPGRGEEGGERGRGEEGGGRGERDGGRGTGGEVACLDDVSQ